MSLEENIFTTRFHVDLYPHKLNNLFNGSSYDISLIKLDAGGNEIFRRLYGGNQNDIPKGLITTRDGNLILLSSTYSFGNGQVDVLLTKLDQTGEVLWEKVYGSAGIESPKTVAEKSNGDLVVLGNTNQGNGNEALFDMFLLETDENGVPR